ncbi:acyl-coenzyme A oxidase 3, peroxisomal-like isoform X4 [Abrus precatorius]|uniref:Acyl-coenzyme A oxidase n=1 Tax=Abrus precatorius TaxID=3816 RepID=A0A8B8KGC4_ABRPR|nr:acyl-coenzyme A oxidase 3, peroxisomal-like isoform X4 [Abrus precatorius]
MADRVSARTLILSNHLLHRNPCLHYSPPELSEPFEFNVREMRKLMDAHNLEDRDWLFGIIIQSKLFNPRILGGKVFVSPDYNQSMEQQREITMRRIEYLLDRGVFKGWLTDSGPDAELRKLALMEVITMYDHSLYIKLGVHFFLWFDNVRIPRENLLNSVADVSPAGEYFSAIKNADQRFAAFLAPLTSGRVSIAASTVYISKISLAIAIRYALTRRAFSFLPNGPEVLLLDYPSHQRRLLPLLAKIYAMSFAVNVLKMMYVKRTPQSNKTLHIVSSAYKATFTWNSARTLQVSVAILVGFDSYMILVSPRFYVLRMSKECREACGGQGFKTENRIGHLRGEFDVQSTFEGDNNVLMQQVSKALFVEYIAAQAKSKPFKGLGLEHMNNPWPVIPSQLTSSTIRSKEFQIDLFHLRERDLLRRFVDEVSQYQTQGESIESAFVLSYQLAEDLGRAFSERAILQNFMEAESTLPPGSLKNVLGVLRSLYALISVDEDASFLRYGYLSTENAYAVRKEVPKLCAELRPHALALVSSFGIPDAFLSPIASNWLDSNSWSSVQ